MTGKHRQARGERAGAAKLNPTKVRKIRRLYKAGGISRSALAQKFGVSRNTIGKVISGETWETRRSVAPQPKGENDMTTEKKMRTLICAILDESGSMGTKRVDVIGGFNGFLDEGS
jgi:DNA-binding XRE family transcriptional regulator